MTQLSPVAEMEATRLASLFKYSPDQERDGHGRFGEGGATGLSAKAEELSQRAKESRDPKDFDAASSAHLDAAMAHGEAGATASADRVVEYTEKAKYHLARSKSLDRSALYIRSGGKRVDKLAKAAPSLPPADPDDQSDAARRALRNIKKEVGDTLDGMRDRVPQDAADAYEANDNADEAMDVIDLDDLDALAAGAIPAALHDVYVNAGQRALDSLKVDDTAIVDLFNRRAANYARERAAELVGKRWVNDVLVENPDAKWCIKQSTRDDLRDMIVKSYEDGRTPAQLARQIEGSFLFSDARAEMIARTETAKASVQGSLGAWQESGVVKGKSWQMSNDHDQDDECNENEDAGVIDLDDDFPSGDDGPPAHPNCMCVCVASLEGPEDEDTEKLAKYNPDQARDDHGRFGEGGGTTAPRTKPLSSLEVSHLSKSILAHGGKVVDGGSPDPKDYDNLQLPTRGQYQDGKGAKLAPSTEGNSCHGMSSRLWKEGDGKYTLVAGFARGIQGEKFADNDWVPHSWCIDGHGKILEGTPDLRKGYFGYRMSSKEAAEFHFINRDNVASKGFKTYSLKGVKKADVPTKPKVLRREESSPKGEREISDVAEKLAKQSHTGWIAVDLDGTLAHFDGDRTTVGAPVAPMLARVKQWLKEGEDVRVFTARVASDPDHAQLRMIQAWCREHVGRALPVTNVKDHQMLELWDDRAVRVGRNTGEPESPFEKTVKSSGGQLDQAPTDDSASAPPHVGDLQDGPGGPVEKFSADQPRVPAGGAGGGEFAGGGSTGGEIPVKFIPSERVQRAIASAVRTGKAEQRAADESERVLSQALGIPRTGDNSAFDVRNDETAIECKTLLDGRNSKITMNKAAIGRKLAEQQAEGLKVYTVVVDRRAGWKAGNPMGHATYYVKQGVGSFHLGSMTKVTLPQLKEMVHGSSEKMVKYSDDQPRVPAGEPGGGEFESNTGGTSEELKGGVFRVSAAHGVSPTTVKAVQERLDGIPKEYRIVPNQVVALQATPLTSMTSSGPSSSNCNGLFRQDTSFANTGAILATSYSGPGRPGRGPVATAETAHHEYGHAVDRYLGDRGNYRSDKSDFRQVFSREAVKASGAGVKFWGTAHHEGFAELYKLATGGRCRFSNAAMSRHFPDSLAVVKSVVTGGSR